MLDAMAQLVLAVVRAHTARTPAPRGFACLGVEHPSGTALDLLHGLATHGIFRKYEQVLDVGAGLGATARWVATRLGCEVVATAAAPAEAVAGALLTARAHCGWQVRHLAARPEALPVRTAAFTHVWFVETLARVADPGPVLSEARRAVRPGGLVALQDLVPVAPLALPGWYFADEHARARALAHAGFVDVVARDVTPDAAERSPAVLRARADLADRLAALDAPWAAARLAERTALASALGAGRLRVVQLLARRP